MKIHSTSPNPLKGHLLGWLLAAAAVGVCVTALLLLREQEPKVAPKLLQGPTEPLPVGSLFLQPGALEPFALTDHQGAVFDRSRLRGKWSFLFFGFTHCPDVCPMTLSIVAQVRDLLDVPGETADDVQFVFVSVDPDRDTPESLGPYVGYFHPEFLGVTGKERALEGLTDQLGAFFRIVERPGQEHFVEHSGSLYLLDPEIRLVAIFPAPHRSRKLVESYHRVRNRERSG